MGIMGFTYTVLPDGSIFKLERPSDYVCAAQIIADEVGDACDGNMLGRPWISTSSVNDDA
jgi:hypothetical protein